MKRLGPLLCVWVFVCIPGAARAQSDRYELGRRLRAFEAAWEEQTDAGARRRCLDPLTDAAWSFYRGLTLNKTGIAEAGRCLDRARFALRAAEAPDPADLWAAALEVRPKSRLLDTKAGEFAFGVETSYEPVKGRQPKEARLCLTLLRTDGKGRPLTADFPLTELPLKGALPLKDVTEADYTLRAEVRAGDKLLAKYEQRVSFVDKRRERLAKLGEVVAGLPREPATADTLTARSLLDLLTDLSKNERIETDYPAVRLLKEAEEAAGKSYYGHKKEGEFWLTLPTGKSPTPVRLMAPAAARDGGKLPLVVALHGVGASENMFFDACGRGAIVALCRKRGWLLVAPRTSGVGPALWAKGPPIGDIIDEVDRLYPVDRKRVFVVGHSMGAKQAVEAACEAPERFAAVAALGGAAPVRPSPALKELPFYVGVGDKDIFLDNARKLGEALKAAGVKTLVRKEYADIEHLVEVSVGLEEVFAFLDKAAR